MGPTTALTQPPPNNGGPYRFNTANHSGRLKYAAAEDLPSYPSSGLKKDGAAAGAAASLGWASTKTPELWKPDPNNYASAAALLANDPKMASHVESHRNTAGPQAAALAAGSARRHQHDQAQQQQQQQQTPSSSGWGNSAANQAFRASRASAPVIDTQTPSLARQGSMRAAKGAMARPRAQSSPVRKELYPDQANAASNARSAATIAHRPSMRSSAAPNRDAGAVPFTTMDRRMFTSNPPVKPEVDERNRNDVLHASAVAMAKKLYSQQQRTTETTKPLVRSSSFSRLGTGNGTGAIDKEQPVYNNLQEAAYRLAQERLAKLHDEHQTSQGLQEYYGSPVAPQRSTFGSIRNKLTRRRSASDGVLLEDRQRSQQIRKQMSLFDTKLAKVDEQKRDRDREALLAAAHRNVQARLKGMDDKLNAEMGRVPPSTMSDWNTKAHAAAQARFDASRFEDQNKIDVGGGKFVERDAIEEIAAKRVQPLLDEINERAERERERKAAEKLEEERQKEETERNKMREREVQEIHKKLKDQQEEQEKARREEIKREEKIRKEAAKATKAERKRAAKEEKQKDKEASPPMVTVGTEPEAVKENSPDLQPEQSTTTGRSRALSINFSKRHSKQKSKDTTGGTSPTLEDGTLSPGNKLKTWFKAHLPRQRANSSPASAAVVTQQQQHDDATSTKKKFIGGAALAKISGENNSVPSIPDDRRSSMREVALAGHEPTTRDETGESSTAKEKETAVSVPAPPRTPSRDRAQESSAETMSVSSMSSTASSLEKFVEARSTLSSPAATSPAPVPSPVARRLLAGERDGRMSPVRGSRFSEILE